VAAQRKRILCRARDAELPGQQVGRLPHVEAAGVVGQPHLQRDDRLEVGRAEASRGGKPGRAAARFGHLEELLLERLGIEDRHHRHRLGTAGA
jgi:hypothetical protein